MIYTRSASERMLDKTESRRERGHQTKAKNEPDLAGLEKETE